MKFSVHLTHIQLVRIAKISPVLAPALYFTYESSGKSRNNTVLCISRYYRFRIELAIAEESGLLNLL